MNGLYEPIDDVDVTTDDGSVRVGDGDWADCY